MLITSLKNLSVYYQLGALRRTIKEEPEYNRVANYQSSNDDFVVEDYGKCAFIDGISLLKPRKHSPRKWSINR
ncbi:P2 family phage major capsid protein [Enterobacter cancerogenus]|uniref:P2 family phage major capsid protein n=1 Tax=Enterobacter cancerogenus TaxID=69218 RepID=UPI0038B8C361